MNKRGFTLMEVLFVIAIIGLLSAAGMYALTSVKSRARDAKRSADLDQLQKALNLYINQTGGAYPIAASPTCLDGDDVVNTALTDANLISVAIVDPIHTDGASCFRYVTDASGTTYSIQFTYETNSIDTAGPHTIP